MQTIEINQDKDTQLKDSVNAILLKKGYHFLYNAQDFERYKRNTKNLVHQAFEIARLFIEDNPEQGSDYDDYIY